MFCRYSTQHIQDTLCKSLVKEDSVLPIPSTLCSIQGHLPSTRPMLSNHSSSVLWQFSPWVLRVEGHALISCHFLWEGGKVRAREQETEEYLVLRGKGAEGNQLFTDNERSLD